MTRTTVRTLLILAAAAGLLAAGIAGCSKPGAPPQQVVRKTVSVEPAKPAGEQAAPAPAPAPAPKPEAALYNAAGKRDPFKPFLKMEEKTAAVQVPDTVPPLQRYDIGELKFVGVIWGRKGILALVEDNEGKGYSVSVGTKIGRGGGTVSRITQKELFVREDFLDFSGTRISRESSITLQNAGGK